MSKIAETKALEAYPILIGKDSVEKGFDWNEEYREVYIQGYDQAMQDFLEKAEKYLVPHIQSILLGDMHDTSVFVQDFKNYMQDEM